MHDAPSTESDTANAAVNAGAPAAPRADDAAPALAPLQAQPRNPLHGVTLEAMLTALVGYYGWPGLAERIALRCFTKDPSIKSSLNVIRRNAWAKEKVESLYLFALRESKRQAQGQRR